MVSQTALEKEFQSQTRAICKKHSSKTIIEWFKNHEQKDNPIFHQKLLVSASLSDKPKAIIYLLKISNPILDAVNKEDGVDFIKSFIENEPNYPIEAYLEALNCACKDGVHTISLLLLNTLKFETHNLCNARENTRDELESLEEELESLEKELESLEIARKKLESLETERRELESLELTKKELESRDLICKAKKNSYSRIISRLSTLINNQNRK